MGVINEMMGVPVVMGTGTATGITPSMSVTDATQILSTNRNLLTEITELAREIRLIATSPLAQKIINKGQTISSGESQVGQIITNPSALQGQSPSQAYVKPQAEPEMDFKNIIVKLLSSVDGKEKLKAGIMELIKFTGDIKLSELISAIEKL